MLRTSEEKFRALVEHSLDGILITDFTGNLLFANRTAGRIAEVEDYEAIAGKRNVLEFVAPASQADVIGDLNKVAQGIDTYHVQYKLITDAKREIWAECIGKKIQFGDSMAMLVSLRDITEYKRAEETMKQSEEWFRTILGSMQSGMIIIDAQTHRILDLNPKALEMIGELKESVVGSICHRFVCPAESGKCPVMDLGQTIDSSERVLLTPRGEEIPILKSVIKTTLGGREVLVESFVDITERKNVEEALRRANRQLSLLTDITRHDLLNKITVIFGNLDIAEDTCTDPAMTWYFRKMEAATRAIQSQIEFTRIYQDLPGSWYP
jgi:PAS domain S-box-containing protein